MVAVAMTKVGSETRCGTLPNHGSQHEAGVRGYKFRITYGNFLKNVYLTHFWYIHRL